MMKYEFACEECDQKVTVNMEPADFKEVKDEGLSQDDFGDANEDFCDCDAKYTHSFNPDDLDICWKGFQWPEKNYKEKKYRKSRSKKMKERQEKVHHNPSLKPNYKGQRTESWREAKEKAKQDPHPRLETTYDPLIEEEQQDES